MLLAVIGERNHPLLRMMVNFDPSEALWGHYDGTGRAAVYPHSGEVCDVRRPEGLRWSRRITCWWGIGWRCRRVGRSRS